MSELKYANLTAFMQGRKLNAHQKADALIEFNSLIERVETLEKDLVYLYFLETEKKQLQQQNQRLTRLLEKVLEGNYDQEQNYEISPELRDEIEALKTE